MDILYDDILKYVSLHKIVNVRNIQAKFRIGKNRSEILLKDLEKNKVIKLVNVVYRVL